MRLKKLHIDHFRHIRNVDIDFARCNNFAVLIGNNGSGKSSIIELIAQLISQVIYNNPIHLQASLEYEIDNKSYNIDKNYKSAQPKIELPQRLVAIYSGEDQKLWELSFKTPYKTRYNNIRYDGIKAPKIYYYDRKYWEISLLTLAISDLPDNQTFLSNVIGILSIEAVKISFNNQLRKKWKTSPNNEILQFYDWLNKNNEAEVVLTLDELKNVAGYEQDFFDNLANCIVIDQENLINAITITYKATSGEEILNASFLSEGEKKLILFRAILEFATQEDTLILLDEPDAHIHESRKADLINLLQEYTSAGRAIVMTTHSAKIADQLPVDNVVVLDRGEQGNVQLVEKGKQDILSKLLYGQYGNFYTSFFASSNIPLLLVEGEGDAKYIKRALDVLGNGLNFDILHFGETGNAPHFLSEIKSCLKENKTIIALFDRDDAGRDGMKNCCGRGDKMKDDVFYKDRVFFTMLPRIPEHPNSEDFIIEDYFHNSFKIKLLHQKVDDSHGLYAKVPTDLRGCMKNTLLSNLSTYTKDDLVGFNVLIDKLKSIVNGSCKIVNLEE